MAKREQMPDVVYHYTSMEALLSILRNKELWATSISYLNDVSEYKLYIETVQRRLPAFGERRPNLNLDVFIENVVLEGELEMSFRRRPFVVSFSRVRDSLTHWRSYCAAGNGVCIGFRVQSLKGASVKTKNPQPGMIVPAPSFDEVMYFDPEDPQFTNGSLELAYRVAGKFLEEDPRLAETMDDPLSSYFRFAVMSHAAFFKDHAFANECEFRLHVGDILLRQDALCFRTTRTSLVPYVPLVIPDSMPHQTGPDPFNMWRAVESITVGPTPNMALSMEAVQGYCMTQGVATRLIASKVPYRDW